MKLARDLAIAPTIFAGVRLREQTYVYDDVEHPERPTRVIESPAYVTEDHALLIGLQMYEDSLCRCQIPRQVAWHADMDGWFEVETVKCQACTAMQQPVDGKAPEPVLYPIVVDTRPPDDEPLSPFVLGLTTASS